MHRIDRRFALALLAGMVLGLLLPIPSARTVAAEVIQVVVWDEQQPQQKPTYDNFLGNQIADYLKSRPGLKVTSKSLGDPDKGLGREVLENCDVLIWWGHVRQQEISAEKGREIVRRIKAGKLSLFTLHSAHWSTPFVEAMYERARIDALGKLSAEDRRGAELKEIYPKPFTAPKYDDPLTPSTTYERAADGQMVVTLTHANCCFPLYRVDAKPGHFKTLLPDHPIAQGLAAKFDVPQTEAYGEPFHVPEPDAVVFEERFDAGEWFRNGMLWKLGGGWVVYFRPGHETYPIYKQPEVLKILGNTVRWLGTKPRRP